MIIFDLDGTLYRTHETCLPALVEMCGRYHLSFTEEDKQFLLYTTPNDLLDKAGSDLDQIQRVQFIEELKWLEIDYVKKQGRLFEHTEELLQRLSEDGIELAICGMGSKEYIDAVLEHCGIKGFFRYIYSRREGVTKGQALRSLLREAGQKPGDCIMVGDSITDMRAAYENEVPFIGVSYGYGTKEIEEAAFIAENIASLQSLIYQQITFSYMEQRITFEKGPFVIGINGVDTSGKTTYADALEHYLSKRGFHTQMVHLDDFHNKRAIRMQDDSAKGYIQNAFDLQKLAGLIANMKMGPVNLEMNLLDLNTDTYIHNKSFISTDQTVIILEGVMLYRPPLDELIDYRVFLDISFEEVIRRARIRDVPLYGEAFLDRYRVKYIPAQEIYLQQYTPKERCQLLIDNNDVRKPMIL